MAEYETYLAALEVAKQEIEARYLPVGDAPWPGVDAFWDEVSVRARELHGGFEATPRNGWRIERRPYRVLISPRGVEYCDGDLLTAQLVAEMRGVSKRTVLSWGERAGLTMLGSVGVMSVGDALGFRPHTVGRPKGGGRG